MAVSVSQPADALPFPASRVLSVFFSFLKDQCDQRPATANHRAMEGIPTQDSQPEDRSPELSRRRVKHQGISWG